MIYMRADKSYPGTVKPLCHLWIDTADDLDILQERGLDMYAPGSDATLRDPFTIYILSGETGVWEEFVN